MTDPLGLIGNAGQMRRPLAPVNGSVPPPGVERPVGPDFSEVMQQEIQRVNELQKDAKEAAEDLVTGRRDDMETVMQATVKADLAFKALMSVRNKVLEAYDEIKQVRV